MKELSKTPIPPYFILRVQKRSSVQNLIKNDLNGMTTIFIIALASSLAPIFTGSITNFEENEKDKKKY